MRGLKKTELEKDPRVTFALMNGNAGDPIFVRRLDAPDRDYYIVPWVSAAGINLIVQVNAITGIMSAAAPLNRPLQQLVISGLEAMRIASRESDQPVMAEPVLVWRPCRESSDPLQPFYQIKLKDGECFIGSDGAFYTTLTPFGQGG